MTTQPNKSLGELEKQAEWPLNFDDLGVLLRQQWGNDMCYWNSQDRQKLKALIQAATTTAVIEQLQGYIDRIDNFKPDPAAPRFGSASGAFETAGWRNRFAEDIKQLKEGK